MLFLELAMLKSSHEASLESSRDVTSEGRRLADAKLLLLLPLWSLSILLPHKPFHCLCGLIFYALQRSYSIRPVYLECNQRAIVHDEMVLTSTCHEPQ